MGALMRSLDWSKTPIGPVDSWSPTLQTMVRTLLANRFPMLLWWGPEYVQLYNDAYHPIPGAKHPRSMGQPASECWPEIWHIIGPLIDTPFHGGPATWMEDILLQINRHGFMEETHFTIAYSPVPDETAAGGIGGVLGTVHEITEKVIGERRMVILRDLGTRPAEAKTAEEACAVAAHTLAAQEQDIPFALLYLTDPDGQHARLAGAAGVAQGEAISPLVIELESDQLTGWPLSAARRSEQAQVVTDLSERFASVPHGPWADPPRTAVVVPIPSNKAHEVAGFLIAGISARLRLDDAYLGFLELARTQIATAVANARAYEEEKRRAEALAELDRAKTAFFSNVSHEFRTPLTLMLGPVEDLLAPSHADLSPAAMGQLEVVHRNGLRLLRLVNTLLDFSRIEAGRARAVFQPTDLAVFTADLASVFRAAVERAGLRLEVDCNSLAEPVLVDREMWEKIVLNLISNAFKFTFEGEIVVSLRQVGTQAELQVRDTGTGIPAEEMPRLFERFHRIENSRGRTHEGSGIGLALVHELVKLHGGSVGADSTLGQGTTFTVGLPLGSTHLPADRIGEACSATSTRTSASAYVEEALRWLPGEGRTGNEADGVASHLHELSDSDVGRVPTDHERPRILVADDNADMRQYVVRLLAERYQVEAVADGEAALAAILRQCPDLVLTDVMMPRLDGFALLQALRGDARTRSVPVIMLSARAGEESRVEGMEAGADDYLVKPFSARELLARVSAHLQMARLRHEASEALRQSHARFEALLNAAPIGVYLVDADMRLRHVNPKAVPMFGSPDELIGSDFVAVVHRLWPQDYADEMVRRFRHTLETGEPHFVPERIEERRDRKVLEYYEWQIHRIRLPDGQFGVVCYFMDISRHVLARQALAEADRNKTEFLATLAHELRNPLAPIRNSLELLKRPGTDATAQRPALAIMDRQLRHLVRLVDDLLDVSRITRGKIVLQKERVELAGIVRNAVEASRPLIEAANHRLTVALPEEKIWLDADQTRLEQVVANLLNNSARYTPPGGEITLAAQPEAGEVVLRVRDTGVGIPADMLPRIFDMFIQVDRSLERSHGGLGIGLTLVQRLVESHGGSVTASSPGPGKGSEFSVRLPIARGRGAPVQVAQRAAGQRPPLRILVVDDNQDSAETLGLLLRKLGDDVHVAHDGAAALAAAARHRPQVVFLDIGMPGMNGYEVARRIRMIPELKHVTLVAQTGWGQDHDRRLSSDAGFDAHLVKPVDLDAVQQLLAALARVNTRQKTNGSARHG
jgi:PAS domain S-box-containing protein